MAQQTDKTALELADEWYDASLAEAQKIVDARTAGHRVGVAEGALLRIGIQAGVLAAVRVSRRMNWHPIGGATDDAR